MCDIAGCFPAIGTAILAVAAAVAFIVTAIALNNGFFTAPASPGFMIAAGVSSLAAAGGLQWVSVCISTFYECVGSPEACAGDLANATNALAALVTVLTIQGAACFAAAGIAWIPFAGAAPMYAIMATLILQFALLISAKFFIADLIWCVEDEVATPSVGPVIAVAAAVAAVAVSLTSYLRRKAPASSETIAAAKRIRGMRAND